MKAPFGCCPVTVAVAAWNALLSARICGATVEMVWPQKVGKACRPVDVFTTVAAPPAIEVTPERLVGHANGAATPPRQTSGVLRKIPLARRGGLSNSTLFQIEFS